MIEDMPKRPLPYLQREDRGKTVSWYVRRIDPATGNGPRIRIRGVYGSQEFMAQYNAALAGTAPSAQDKPAKGTLKWLIDAFTTSSEWYGLARETRKQLGYQFDRLAGSAGAKPLSDISPETIIVARDKRAARPSDANKFLKASRRLFAHGIVLGAIKSNPAVGVAKIKVETSGDGFHTWTEAELRQYEAFWKVGTRQRLAFDILRYTGLRKGDAVKLGWQHVTEGVIQIRTSKTGQLVELPMLWPLATSIKATPTGEMTFLVTAKGTPFGKESFGMWFLRACRAAKVPGSAHGIRKATASEIAELGGTESQLNSFFGWAEGSRESATYTKKARRKTMARAASKLISFPTQAGRTSNLKKDTGN